MAVIDMKYLDLDEDEIKKIVKSNIHDHITGDDVEAYMEDNLDFISGSFVKEQLEDSGYILVESHNSAEKLSVPQMEALEFMSNHLNTITLDDLLNIVKQKNPGEELL